MSADVLPVARFRLGRINATPRVLEAIPNEDVLIGIRRHQAADWGELSKADKAANDRSLEEGTRILSAYRSAKGITFWIITEADRSYSTVLLPSDY